MQNQQSVLNEEKKEPGVGTVAARSMGMGRVGGLDGNRNP